LDDRSPTVRFTTSPSCSKASIIDSVAAPIAAIDAIITVFSTAEKVTRATLPRMSLSPEARDQYVPIIDSILAKSDLNTISEKRIRKGLQEEVGYDLTPHKAVIKQLIMERFDIFAENGGIEASPEAVATAPATNGHSSATPVEASSPAQSSKSQKRQADSVERESDKTPPAKKKKSDHDVDADALFAAKLQAEENMRARPTRGASARKAQPAKKKTTKAKTSKKVKAEDDSDVDSGSDSKKVNRSGGFHKPLTLSPALSALLGGEESLSRPQTVKKVWAYIREHELQDPTDRRQIRCDEPMRAVFKQDRIHMFTMTKILSQNLGSGPRRGGGRDKQNRSAPNKDSGPEPSGQPTQGQTIETGDKGKTATAAPADDADDGEICFICASTVEHTSVSPCNHRTCHICALRLRALYKNKACAHCRTESSYVIFTNDHAKPFQDFKDSDFSQKDDNLGIKYENNEIFEDTVLLLRYNCPDTDCDVACLGWPDLHRHVKSKHGKVMCDLCTRNKKVFTHEHELFTVAELRKHEKYGDHVPGAVEQSGFKGHPECGFCRQRFYGDDELYTHCRDRHERCHICDRRSANRQQQYYIDYNALEDHFQKDHFLCLDKECLEKKFVVFESEMDMKAHQLECHPNGLSKDARRDARTVDLSSFDYRTPYQPQRQRRGAGRGRDPNSEPLPVSSAQPLTRAEIAYQRQMAIQSAQSVSTRSFGGQLTRNDTQTVHAPPRTPASRTPPAASTPVAELQDLSLGHDSGSATPQEQARRLRHAAVVERAANLLGNDQNKLNEFRSKVSTYRTSALTATELIDGFFSLFDTSTNELGKLVKELAEIYENDSKRTALLKAWNDWRAINEDYPALPGPGGLLPGMSPSTVNGSGAGGKRVLRLNPQPPSPLAQPSAEASAAASNSNTPWATASPAPSYTGPSYAGPSSRPAPKPSNPSRPANTGNAEAFPALPAAPKPNVLMAGLTRGTVRVRWDGRDAPNSNAWASGGSGTSTPGEPDSDFGESSAGGGKKGKGKKGKQTLFHFG
ncbi:putative C2H2 finger domain protein, partial [Aspergillus nomiae NRRL 13137]